MDQWITSAIGFVEANRDWAFWIALVFAAAETTALISIIIPSTAILVGVGALVATGAVSFWPIWGGAAVGSAIGSCFSYWLGHRYGETILGLWPMRNYPDQMQRGKEAFNRYGLVAIIVGHFFGPLRSVVFLICGMSSMKLRQFLPWNLAGCVAWSALVPLTGVVGGSLIGWLWGVLGF